MNKLSWFSLNPKWYLEEIQSYEDLLQFKMFVLGSAKKTINVVAIENKKVILTERRCKITLEDF